MGSTKEKRSLRWLRRICTAAIAIFLVYTAAGFLLFPMVLRSVAAGQLAQFPGRVQKIDFNPYTLSIAVHGIQIDNPAGGIIFSLETLRGTFAAWVMLAHRTLAFTSVVLDKPSVVVERSTNGAFSFASLVRLDWPKSIRLQAQSVRLTHGEIHFRDGAVPGGFSSTISDLTATINGFSTTAGHAGTFSISAVTEAGEKLSASGSLRVHPLSSQGDIAAEGVQLGRYSPYFAGLFTFGIAGGELTARMSYDVDLDPNHFTFLLHDGAITSRSLTVSEQESSSPVFHFERLGLSDARVDLVARSIGIGSIVVTGGSAAFWRLADKSFNVQHLIRSARVPAASTSAPSSPWSVAVGEIRLADGSARASNVFGRETLHWKDLAISNAKFQVNPLAVSIAALNLQDGTLTFVDPSVTPPVTLVLNHLAVRIGEFSSADSPAASVTVDAETGNAAHLQISGETNPIGAQRETSLRALVRNGSILPLSPYAETYLGYELQAGELSLDVSFHMSSRAISAQTTLEITHFAFGRQAESENATKLPIRLVVFLLTDSSGKITLRLPLERGLDNSPFDLRKTIVDAVLRPFQETARFPFTVLSGVPGSESGELGVQEFLPGSAELEPRETGKLDVIRRGLQRWPELMLDVEGSVDAADETADPHFLAVERADAVKEYLLRDGAMDPGRIFLIDNGPANVAEKGSRAFLSLKDRYRAVVDVGAGVEGKR